MDTISSFALGFYYLSIIPIIQLPKHLNRFLTFTFCKFNIHKKSCQKSLLPALNFAIASRVK